MEYLQCKACGSYSMIPVEVENEDFPSIDAQDENGVYDLLDEILDPNIEEPHKELAEEESRYFNCHVCGDNWMTIKEVELSGKCQITFIHQMGMFPILKRIANMQTQIILNEQTVQEWEYFLNDKPVEEAEWLDKLQSRRKVLKSVCSN